MRTNQLVKWAASGAAGGVAGSIAMDAMRFVGKKAGLIHKRTLPHQLEKELERRVGFDNRTSPAQEMVLTQAMHIGLGAGFGLVYGIVAGLTGSRSIARNGLAYSLAVSGLDLVLLGPATGLTAGPWNQPAPRAMRRFVSHLLFGFVTVAVTQRVWERLE
jgi:hypothetical protein